MALVVNTNVASLNAQRNLEATTRDAMVAMERLSTGMRINSAKDDAAGLAIGTRLQAQVNGFEQAARNAADAISVTQTAEGALTEVTSNLQRLRELAVQSVNSTNSSADRKALQTEAAQLIAEIDRVAGNTKFVGTNLLDGTFTSKLFQVGADKGQTVTVTKISDARSTGIGINKMTLGGTKMNATTSGSDVNNAIAAETDLTLTTVDGGTTAAISYSQHDSAKDIATAINTAASSIGITATATNSAVITSLSVAGTVTFDLMDGATTYAVSAVVSDVNDLSAIVNAVNSHSANSGITAAFTSTSAKNSITLSNLDGEDIGLGTYTNSGHATATISFGGATLTEGGTVDAVRSGQIVLTSTKGQITAANGGTDVFTSAGQTSSFTTVSATNLETATGAANAIEAIDGALDMVNLSRAELGAYTSRFESIINSVAVASDSAAASASRIQDADFAKETAAMTKSQILSQAGISVLAQANAMPQQVLALLQ
ncbi:MAG: flagellin [Pseudomonadota bacterium]|nr:flagellin [Pseudomonadota bacterium]